MKIEFLWFALLGGVLPDIMRLLKLKETDNYNVPDYLTQPMFYILLIVQVGIGLLIVSISDVTTKIQAVAYAYAGPQFLGSLLSGIINRVNQQSTPATEEEKKKAAATVQEKKYGRMARILY